MNNMNNISSGNAQITLSTSSGNMNNMILNPAFIAPTIVSSVAMNVTSICIHDNHIILGTSDGEVHIYHISSNNNLVPKSVHTVNNVNNVVQVSSSTLNRVKGLLYMITDIIKKYSQGRNHIEDEQLLLNINKSPEFKDFGTSVKDLQNVSIIMYHNNMHIIMSFDSIYYCICVTLGSAVWR